MFRSLILLAIYFGALAVLSLLTISAIAAAEPPQRVKPRITIVSEQPANLARPATIVQPPAVAPAAAAAPRKSAAPPPAIVVGRWSAARSEQEAFAMQLDADGTFILVFVKSGEPSYSTGSFTLAGDQLTLTTSEGGAFAGQISNVSAGGFEFLPQGAAIKLSFQRAT